MEICRKKNAVDETPATLIHAIGEVVPAATTTVNAPVAPSSSVPAHTSADRPLQQHQQQQQQNESRPIVTATPAPQQNARSQSTTNTITITITNTNINININININTNQVPETLPFRSFRSTSSADPDRQKFQELQRTERVYERQLLNELATIIGFESTVT